MLVCALSVCVHAAVRKESGLSCVWICACVSTLSREQLHDLADGLQYGWLVAITKPCGCQVYICWLQGMQLCWSYPISMVWLHAVTIGHSFWMQCGDGQSIKHPCIYLNTQLVCLFFCFCVCPLTCLLEWQYIAPWMHLCTLDITIATTVIHILAELNLSFFPLQPDLPYHTSALLAATLDTISLPYR